ncbi:uncharacterized protein LOC130700387 [Daphnia carinata]|uniref:uncharacterized protein LOC130700387 n=1 Tax=Daphnia carinata TaxID=120202 RepID=UPI00257BE734|nr:uncharacterized protein LOC130700387 [Daphnia carinata]
MLWLTKVRNNTTLFVCLFLIQLSVSSAGPTRSSNSVADKLRTLANIRRSTRNDPYALQAYYRPNDANELNHEADTNELFIATTEQLLPVEPEMNTESTGIHDPAHTFVFSEGLHVPHSATTEHPAFADFQESFHSISNDRESAPEDLSVSLSFPLLPTAPSDSVHLPLTYPSVNATTFPLATYIGIGSLPLMPNEAIPFVTSESPDNAVVPDNLAVASPEQVNNGDVVPLDWIQKESTTPASYTGSPFSINHPTDDSYIVSTIPTKFGSSSGRPFGSSPQPRELGFPPVSNTHENFDVQVNWAEFR